jgi:hypothetical protein
VVEPTQPLTIARQIIVDHLSNGHVPPPDAFREESALVNLVLPFLVDLDGERLRTDLLAVSSAVLVEVADPPGAGARRPLENTRSRRLPPPRPLPSVSLMLHSFVE